MLSQEASKADASRHYGFYIDGDIAKLPGGGRKGAAILCELLPKDANPSSNNQRYNPSYNSYPQQPDGGYPDYYNRQRSRQ